MKYLFYILILFPAVLYGQIRDFEGEVPALKGIIYNHEYSFELKLHTFGMSAGFNRGKLRTYYRTDFHHFDIGVIRSPKEKKGNLITTSLNFQNRYVYGKANHFFPVRAGRGMTIYLSEKDIDRGLAIGYTLSGGFTMGVLKPYYLWVKNANEDTQLKAELLKYDGKNADVFTNQDLIFDKASFLKGITELKMIPGIHFNAAVHYGIKAYEKSVLAFETGIMLDVFIAKVPLMVETEDFRNSRFFVNVFFNVQLGKRWN